MADLQTEEKIKVPEKKIGARKNGFVKVSPGAMAQWSRYQDSNLQKCLLRNIHYAGKLLTILNYL